MTTAPSAATSTEPSVTADSALHSPPIVHTASSVVRFDTGTFVTRRSTGATAAATDREADGFLLVSLAVANSTKVHPSTDLTDAAAPPSLACASIAPVKPATAIGRNASGSIAPAASRRPSPNSSRSSRNSSSSSSEFGYS